MDTLIIKNPTIKPITVTLSFSPHVMPTFNPIHKMENPGEKYPRFYMKTGEQHTMEPGRSSTTLTLFPYWAWRIQNWQQCRRLAQGVVINLQKGVGNVEV